MRLFLPVTESARVRLVTLEAARKDAGGCEEYSPPPLTKLLPDELRYHAEIRRNTFQGTTPRPGSIGPAPWYLRLQDAADYASQRLALHRAEVARLQAVQASGRYVRPPSMAAADCIVEGLGIATPSSAGRETTVQVSVPERIIRAAGHTGAGRDLSGLIAALPAWASTFGLTDGEAGELQAVARTLPVLPPPPPTVVARLAAALADGLAAVERSDALVQAAGGLVSRLPPADVWRCETWERLRREGREVPPLPW